MKKTVSLLLSLTFLLQNIAFAKNIQSFSEINLNSNNANKKADTTINKPNFIDCDKPLTNEQGCKYLEISKTDFVLKSTLGKNYNAHTYTIKNITDKNIEIVKWNSDGDHINPDNIIKGNNFIELKQALQLIALTPVFDVMYLVSAATVVPMIFLLADCETKKDRLMMLTLPISAPATGVWYTIASPYYYISEKKNDKKASKESVNIIKDYPAQEIKPTQQITFNALVQKQGPFCNKFKFYFKEKNSPTVYIVRM